MSGRPLYWHVLVDDTSGAVVRVQPCAATVSVRLAGRLTVVPTRCRVCRLPALSLSWNPMSLVAADRLSRAVVAVSTLTTLELDYCDIDANGAMLLALVLRTHPCLEVLSVCSDPYKRPFVTIGCVGVVAMARALEYPKSKLKSLRWVLQPSSTCTRTAPAHCPIALESLFCRVSHTLALRVIPDSAMRVPDRRESAPSRKCCPSIQR